MPNGMQKIASMSIIEASMLSLICFAIVFVVLTMLMYVFHFLHAFIEKRELPALGIVAGGAAPSAVETTPARGSLGEVGIFDVEEKTAAMVMAIVAHELGAPLNELRFISIREKRRGKTS